MAVTSRIQNICVAGVGAVGTVVAHHLSKHFPDVSVIARGETLRAVKKNGLSVRSSLGVETNSVKVSDGSDLLAQDLVFLCVKAQDLAGMARSVRRVLHADTLIVPVVNGVPFWFPHGLPAQVFKAIDAPPTIRSVDRHGDLATIFPPRNIVGASVMIIAQKLDYGSSQLITPPAMTVGNIIDSQNNEASIVADILNEAGISTTVSPTIRAAVWRKLCANVANNGLSVLTECTIREICENPDLLKVSEAIFEECIHLGAFFEISGLNVSDLVKIMRQAGNHRTSMLQDYEAGRPLELEAIGDAVAELARIVGEEVPLTQQITRLVRHKAQNRKSDGQWHSLSKSA
jgi:2-dehydropantoate 2-reductase